LYNESGSAATVTAEGGSLSGGDHGKANWQPGRSAGGRGMVGLGSSRGTCLS